MVFELVKPSSEFWFSPRILYDSLFNVKHYVDRFAGSRGKCQHEDALIHTTDIPGVLKTVIKGMAVNKVNKIKQIMSDLNARKPDIVVCQQQRRTPATAIRAV